MAHDAHLSCQSTRTSTTLQQLCSRPLGSAFDLRRLSFLTGAMIELGHLLSPRFVRTGSGISRRQREARLLARRRQQGHEGVCLCVSMCVSDRD